MDSKSYKKGLFTGIAITLVVALMAGASIFIINKAKSVDLDQNTVRKINTIQKLVDEVYLFDYDEDDVSEGIYAALVESLGDKYSTYYTKEEYEEINQAHVGNKPQLGIKVSIDDETEYPIIKGFEEGSDAIDKGLEEGDLIVAIEGQDTKGLSISEIATMLSGDMGTSANITILRDGVKTDYSIERRELEADYVGYIMLDNNIGYIYISSFTTAAAKQFEDAYEKLTEQGMEAVIFDIRDNTGGLLTSVNSILDYLLPEGLMVYTEDKNGKRQEYNSTAEEANLTVPCAILTNGNTASASEVFSGALKDYELAITVGTTTFGKGIVQNIYPLEDGSAVKLTVADYYTPNGNNIHGVGILPDIEVEYDENEIDENGIDNQVQAAIDYLNGEK